MKRQERQEEPANREAPFSSVWSLYQVPREELEAQEAMVGSWQGSPVPAAPWPCACIAASSVPAVVWKSNGIDWSDAGNTASQSTRDPINQLITSYEVYTRQPDGHWRYPFSSLSASWLSILGFHAKPLVQTWRGSGGLGHSFSHITALVNLLVASLCLPQWAQAISLNLFLLI